MHYDAPPPSCQDYGVIFLADDMRITLAQPGVYAPFGNGCAGSLPVAHLTAAQPPRIGTTLLATVDNLPVNYAFMLTGWSNTTSSLGALPFQAAPLGMPGCAIYTSADAIDLLSGAGGIATYQLVIPGNLALVGLSLYQQALVLDPAYGNALNAVLSMPAHLVVGL